MNSFWEMQSAAPPRVVIDGVEVVQGSRVRLRPRPGGDVFDMVLAGKVAFVEAIEQDFEENIHVAVTIEDDPGRDLGDARQPGHRFFFSLEEVEPLNGSSHPSPPAPVSSPKRILVAGIGNIFLGDDGFGVAVARRLAQRSLPDGVRVVDFGIRGMDLVYALLEEHDAVILVDIAPRGEKPGTLFLIEPPTEPPGEVTLDTHGMDPVKVLALARELGARPARTFVVGCEPEFVLSGEDNPDVVVELSPPVQAAVEEAVKRVESLVAEIMA